MSDFNANSTIGYLRGDPDRFAKQKKGLFGKQWVNVATGNPITTENDRKLDVRTTSPEEAIELFDARSFKALFDRPMTDSGPLHIDWARCPKDRFALVQLRMFRSNTSLDPITDVVEVHGEEYDRVFG